MKNLANQTGKATEEIAAQIGQIQNATKEAVAAIHDITQTIEQVSTIASSIAAAMEEQGSATAEIARNVQQTAASTDAVRSNIAGVSQAAADTGGAADQVLGAAGQLSRQADELSREVTGFVAGVPRGVAEGSGGGAERAGDAGLGQLALHRLFGQALVQQTARIDQLRQIDAGGEAHALQHEHQVLGDDVAGGARRVGTAAKTGETGIEGADAFLSPDERIGDAETAGVVQMQAIQRVADRLAGGTDHLPDLRGCA